MTKIFLGGFPLESTELELVQIVSLHGSVETIKIVRDKKTRVCKGYAFLEMTDRAAADSAVEGLDGADFGGRKLTVNIVDENKPAKRPGSFGARKPFNRGGDAPRFAPPKRNY